MGTNIYSVSQITNLISMLLEENFPESVWIEGEVSNLTYHSSGHVYFSLKDKDAVLKVVLFRRYAEGLRFQLAEGLAVSALGRINVYPRSGQYQLVAEQVKPLGIGELALAFEQLKEKLRAEGLFLEEHKRPLLFFIQRIGIVTSETGAALRDMLQVIWRRHPGAEIIFAPARVQGEGARESITGGIKLLNADGRAQVIIIGRGGGSLEDLWAFNEEMVARAVYNSTIPVVSAVGHEVDFVITDFVADVRAATPTAAGELVTKEVDELRDRLGVCSNDLDYLIFRKYTEAKDRLNWAFRHPGMRRVQETVENLTQDIDRLEERAQELYRIWKREKEEQLRLQAREVANLCRKLIDPPEWGIRQAEGRLLMLEPKGILERGYSILSRNNGEEVVYSTVQVKCGEELTATVSDGEVNLQVLEKGDE